MVNYKVALGITILVALIAIILVKFVDDMRFNSLSKQISDSILEGDSTRLILLYPQIFRIEDKEKLCAIVDFNTKRQMDKGFHLVNLLKVYEEANLLSDYEIARKKYFISNVELWFYITQNKEVCNKSDIISMLFFHSTKTKCPECVVQGQILDRLREKCNNLRIITLANDLDIEIIELIKQQYNITSAPSLVIDNKIVLSGVKTEEEILNYVKCK